MPKHTHERHLHVTLPRGEQEARVQPVMPPLSGEDSQLHTTHTLITGIAALMASRTLTEVNA